MKKFNLFTLLVLFASLCFSCSDDEEITSISISEGSSLTLYLGTTQTLHISYIPETLQAPICTWISSDQNIVTVSSSGVLTPIKEGTATITATTEKALTAYCSITVEPVRVAEIKLNYNEYELLLGENVTLTAQIVPDNATYPNIIWSSSDESIATVSNGVVTAVGIGKCQIIAKDEKEDTYTTCNLIVNPIEMESIVFSTNNIEIELNRNYKIEYSILPENTTFKNIKWSSSNNDIASIDEEGTITTKGIGECTIYATNEAQTVKAECSITVIPVKVKNIYFNLEGVQPLVSGSLFNLNEFCVFEPADAANKKIIWTSSNSAVASVDEKGMVKANKVGSAIIKAETEEGHYTASIEVSVKDITDFVTLTASRGGGTWMQIGSTIVAAEFSLEAKINNSSKEKITIKDIYILNKYNNTKITNIKESLGSYSYGTVKISNNYSTTDPYLNYYYWTAVFSYNGKDYTLSKKAW